MVSGEWSGLMSGSALERVDGHIARELVRLLGLGGHVRLHGAGRELGEVAVVVGLVRDRLGIGLGLGLRFGFGFG